MGAAPELLAGGPEQLYTLLFGVVCIVLEVWISYPRYAAILKWTTLSLLSYVAVVLWRTSMGACAKVLIRSEYRPDRRIRNGDGGDLGRQSALICSSGRPARRWRRNIAAIPNRFACRQDRWPGADRIRIDTITGMASVRWCRWRLCSRLRRHCMRTELPTLPLRRRPPRHCAHRGRVASRCLLPGSSAPGCWRCRCWQDRLPMQSAKCLAGPGASMPGPMMHEPSTRR